MEQSTNYKLIESLQKHLTLTTVATCKIIPSGIPERHKLIINEDIMITQYCDSTQIIIQSAITKFRTVIVNPKINAINLEEPDSLNQLTTLVNKLLTESQ